MKTFGNKYTSIFHAVDAGNQLEPSKICCDAPSAQDASDRNWVFHFEGVSYTKKLLIMMEETASSKEKRCELQSHEITEKKVWKFKILNV